MSELIRKCCDCRYNLTSRVGCLMSGGAAYEVEKVKNNLAFENCTDFNISKQSAAELALRDSDDDIDIAATSFVDLLDIEKSVFTRNCGITPEKYLNNVKMRQLNER